MARTPPREFPTEIEASGTSQPTPSSNPQTSRILADIPLAANMEDSLIYWLKNRLGMIFNLSRFWSGVAIYGVIGCSGPAAAALQKEAV
jgi:hypothetical protein